MGAFDFNTAKEQSDYETVPAGTIAVIQMNIRAGDVGEGGILSRSKSGEAEGLDAVFTVVEGKYAKRKFFAFMVVSGTSEGHATAGQITHSKLRAILESARGIKPTDVSEAAKKARNANYADFDGIRFIAKIGIEKGTNGYRDKNVLEKVITPEMKEWHSIEQPDRSQLDARKVPEKEAASSNAIVKPVWAK
jgi:hypothetical protein